MCGRKVLRECLKIAQSNIHRHKENYKHYSFIISDKIIAVGINREGPALIERGYPIYGKRHAETEAYRKAKGLLRGSFDCVNIRLNKSGELRLSAPCDCCYGFLMGAGCNHIYFTTNQGFARL